MFSTDDTIVAIATPAGRGGIGVVRISGPSAGAVANGLLQLETPLKPRYATFARTQGDQVVATYFPAPHSYTGEHVFEISAHGSPVVLRQIVQQAMSLGARLAEPGEFTLRAFLNGRIDLVQAEAVADLIDAVTPLQARAAFDQLEGTLTERIASIDSALFDLTAKLEASLDFPDEGYHFVEAGDALSAVRAIEHDIGALLCEVETRAFDSRRRTYCDSGQTERREIEPVQRAASRGPRDRDADSRDDPRSRHRDSRRRRHADRAGRHSRPARHHRRSGD